MGVKFGEIKSEMGGSFYGQRYNKMMMYGNQGWATPTSGTVFYGSGIPAGPAE